jgi:hypothetical protein
MPENMNDLAIPEIKLVQNVGGDEAKAQGALPGDFYCALTGEVFPGTTGFDIVVTGTPRVERTYWGENHEVQSDEPPTCSSTDGVTSVNGDDCKTACPYKAFTDAPGLLSAEDRKGKCAPGYRVSGISLSNMMPVFIRCSGISATAARELKTLLLFHINIRGQYFKAKFTVTAVKKKTASGEAFQIKFGEPHLLEEAMMGEVKELMVAIGVVILEVQKALAPPPAQIDTPQQEPIESSPQDLARAKAQMEAGKKASGYVTDKTVAGTVVTEPPGTVVLGKKDTVPPAVQKLAVEVKRKLPDMNF